jgi:hypothetical protein
LTPSVPRNARPTIVRKRFFFAKKNQKTSPGLASAAGGRPGSNGQKFFGSFFKKEPLSV